jgi:platelet-activating factor acetylhydrolase IB subunit alpha
VVVRHIHSHFIDQPIAHHLSTQHPTIHQTWDLETGEYERTLKGHTNAVQALAFNRSGNLLASCSSDLSIKLWDFGPNSTSSGGAGGGGGQECLRTLRGHDHNISGLVFLPQGDQLVSCSRYGDVYAAGRSWHAKSSSALHTHRAHRPQIINPSPLSLPTHRDKTLKVWEAASGFCVKTLTGHTDWVRCLAASADGSLLASGGSDQSVIVWNVATGQPTLTLKEHTHVVESVAFPPPGAAEVRVGSSSVAATPEKGSGSGSGGSSNDSGAADKENSALVTPRRRGLTASGDGKAAGGAPYLVSGGRDKAVRVWDLASGLCLMAFTEHENWVRAVAFHPSGQYALSCSDDRSVRVFDVARGRCLRTLGEAHAQFVTAIAQHATLPYLASGGVDREIKVWECR